MSIRVLSRDDFEAYEYFRRGMWPVHTSAGYWEAALMKYCANPHSALCAQSGLYGFFNDGKLIGTMGAYPMPITLNGTLHPGHMLVDWAILPNYQFSPVAGKLWSHLIDLPGRKFASHGRAASQLPLSRRATELPSSIAIAIMRPLDVAMLRLLRLTASAHPSPIQLQDLKMPDGIATCAPAFLQPATPGSIKDTAFVLRGPDFWDVYCSARIYNGSVPLLLTLREGTATAVVRLYDVGRLRFASLMNIQLYPPSDRCAASVGRLLGRFLRENRVCYLSCVTGEPTIERLLQSLKLTLKHYPIHWWMISKPSDTFSSKDVRWWFTLADQDSHWGGLQPIRSDAR